LVFWKLTTCLAEVLRDKGYVGETVADMLKTASFKTVQLAWDAHGIRNRIAHEGSDFQLTEREAKRAFMHLRIGISGIESN
jgi:hypothetical protein